MQSYSQKSILLWTLLSLAAMAGGIYSLKFFGKAFPIVNLDLKVTREQILELAAQEAKKLNLGPANFDQAVSFDSDDEVQTYVELEAGGKSAFTQMIKDPYYAPFQWRVRHFKQFEKNETNLFFKPDGTFYGFKETISEDQPGAQLSKEEARKIGEATAIKSLGINFADYGLIEESKELKPGGRLDHTFTYERPTVKIGNGDYRLKIVVSGDKVTQIDHFVRVPAAFNLKYQEMRSANNSLASLANMFMIILYIICGCFLGLFFLALKRWIVWRPALIWACIVAGLSLLNSFNELPLAWISYNTALSTKGFLVSFIISIITSFFLTFAFYFIAFMAAESLTRYAFGDQLQFWKTWKNPLSYSKEMLGQTIGGYLLVPLFFAYTITFYYIANTYFGWWSPSGALTNPNILATYFPWLASIAISLGAGFMEECVFRAIPIAGSAILGDRFGSRRIGLIIGFIIQAFIFSAAHANYPAQPAYARLVELFFFSIVQGLIYLRWGLIPVIISHFTYDVVWIALPIFVSSAMGIWLSRGIVILLTFIPLLVLLYSRLRSGKWISAPDTELNRSWQPPLLPQEAQAPQAIQEQSKIDISQKSKTATFASIIIGLGIWLFTTNFKQDAPAITFTKDIALMKAHAFSDSLRNQGFEWHNSWQSLPKVIGQYDSTNDTELQHKFVWQKAGKDMYHKLIGEYLTSPAWAIRHLTFNPDLPVQDRAEEYYLIMRPERKNSHFFHVIPEHRPGADLQENQAREIAHKALQDIELQPQSMKEISAVATKHPTRKDWTFTFADPSHALEQGQARIDITIAGDKLAGVSRYIFVPESWQRTEHNNELMHYNISTVLLRLLMIIICLAILALFKQYGLIVDLKSILIIFGILAVASLIQLFNGYPVIIAGFNTSEPFQHQIFRTFGMGIIFRLLRAAGIALMLGIILRIRSNALLMPRSWAALVGIAVGIAGASLHSVLSYFEPSLSPIWAEYAALGYHLPWVMVIIQMLFNYITYFIILMLLTVLAHFIFDYSKKSIPLTSLFFIIIGILIAGSSSIEHLPYTLLTGLLLGIFLALSYFLAVRFDQTIIPIALALYLISGSVWQMVFNAYPGALIAHLATAIITLLVAWLIFIEMRKKEIRV